MVYSRSTYQLIVIRGKKTNRFYVFGVRDDYMLVRALYCPAFCARREAVVQLQPGRAGVLVQQRVDTACRRKGESTAQKELKNLSDETGMFDSIPDEQIQQNLGISYQDQQAMRDSLAGRTMDTVPMADGGASSGNFNHAGRPGQVGGSGGGGDLTNGSQGGILQSSQMPEWSSKQAKEPFNYWDCLPIKQSFRDGRCRRTFLRPRGHIISKIRVLLSEQPVK